MAPTTKCTRNSQWNSYIEFCASYNLTAVPASHEVICLYVAYLSSRKLEFSTVTNYLASLVSLHTFKGHPSPDLQHPQIRAAMAGLRRNRPELPNRKQGIEVKHLLAIHASLHHVKEEIRSVFWTACLLLFFTLLRRSNIFWAKGNTSSLKRSDVRVENKDVTLHVCSIKNTRFQGVRYTLPLPRIPDSILCPTRAVLALQKVNAKLPGSAPLLSTHSHTRNVTAVPLDARVFTDTLQSLLKLSFTSVGAYTIHSFRRGSTTFAASAGISVASIKAQGTWRSDCHERYINRDFELRKDFAKGISQAICKSPKSR
jgi:hypothetical protein